MGGAIFFPLGAAGGKEKGMGAREKPKVPGTTVTHGAPCRLPHPRGIAGPLRHCGARGSLPSLPHPLDAPMVDFS